MKRRAANCKLTENNVRRSKRLMGVPAPDFQLPVYRQPWWRAIPAYEPEDVVHLQRAPPDSVQRSPLPLPAFSVPHRRCWSKKASMHWPTVARQHLEQATNTKVENRKQGIEQHAPWVERHSCRGRGRSTGWASASSTLVIAGPRCNADAEDSESSVQGSLMPTTPRTPPSPSVAEFATTEVQFEQDTDQRSGFTDADGSQFSGEGPPMPGTPRTPVSTPRSVTMSTPRTPGRTPSSVSTLDSAYQDFCSRRDAFLNECCSQLL